MFRFQQFKADVALRAMLTMLLVGAVSVPLATRAQAQAAAKFGSVDLTQVANESKAQQKEAQDLKAALGTYQVVLQKMNETSARFLSEAEIKELAGLYEKKTPSDAEKKRISTLEDSAALKLATRNRLENTPTPSDEQRKQYQDITTAERNGVQVLNGIQGDYRTRMENRQNEATNRALALIKAAVAKVAKDQGIMVVFDSQAAVYTANDITADVIKEINK